MKDLIDKGYIRQFIARDGRARSEPIRDKRDRSRSPPSHSQLRNDCRLQPANRREVRTDNRVTREMLVISGGPTERDSSNSKKASSRRVRHEVVVGTLQPISKRPYSLTFNSTTDMMW